MTASLPAHGHVRGCLFRRDSWLSNMEQTCPKRMRKPSQKAAPAPNSHIKPLLWALPCQSLNLVKTLDPFLLVSLQKVSSCPLTTQTQGMPHHQGRWWVLGQECCWNSQHLPASLMRKESLLDKNDPLSQAELYSAIKQFLPFLK